MYQRTRPPEKSQDPSKTASGLLSRGFLHRKNRAKTPKGGGKRTVFVKFSSPLLSPPPWRPLMKLLSKLTRDACCAMTVNNVNEERHC